MSLPGSLIERLSVHLTRQMGHPVDIERAQAAGGGSVNDAFRLDTDAGRFFVKVNHADRFPSLFEAEADGLRRLQVAGVIRTPKVIAAGEDHDESYLLLEHIDTALPGPGFWEGFGTALAALHRHTAEKFGLARANYIGTLRQDNTPHPDWATFFIQCRLEPQVKMARDRKRIGDGDVLRFERLYRSLPELFPVEAPALLHGDLWNGNFLCDTHGQPVLIDPAVYFGHREMDLAMARLFSGFDPAFHQAYQAAWPLQPGWEERVDLCNLYPLLVHVNLFGGTYAAQVHTILARHT